MERLQQAKINFEQHNFPVHIVNDKEDAKQLVSALIQDGEKVAHGGSTTLVECDIISMLKQRNIQFMPHKLYEHPDEAQAEALHAFSADVYICSANAITMRGEIVCVDGIGNRVANIIYGPKRVLLVCGKNKLTEDLKSAYQRIATIAGPRNNQRLETKNPCTQSGNCSQCTTSTRICNAYITLVHQLTKRIHIILIDEELGY